MLSGLPTLHGIQLPALLLWVAAPAVSALRCCGSSWKSSRLVEWWRECALWKLHCGAYLSVCVPAPGWWESSIDDAVSHRLLSTSEVVSTSCWFYFLVGFCPNPGINVCTRLEKRKQSLHLKPLLHWARRSWHACFWGNFCKKQDHLGTPSKCVQVSSKAQSALVDCCWSPDIWGCDAPGSQTPSE